MVVGQLGPHAIATLLAEQRNAVIEECARVAELFSINKTSIHPNLTWDEMSEQAQRICHTTCQQVAAAIRALKDKP